MAGGDTQASNGRIAAFADQVRLAITAFAFLLPVFVDLRLPSIFFRLANASCLLHFFISRPNFRE